MKIKSLSLKIVKKVLVSRGEFQFLNSITTLLINRMSQLTKAWKIICDPTVIFCELKCPWDIAHIGHSEVQYSPPQSPASQGWLKHKCKGLNYVQDKMSHSGLPGKILKTKTIAINQFRLVRTITSIFTTNVVFLPWFHPFYDVIDHQLSCSWV